MGKPTVLAAGLGIGAILILWSEGPQHHAAAPAGPKPVTRTVIVHQTVTRVVQSGSHPNGIEITIIALFALAIFCAITLGRRS